MNRKRRRDSMSDCDILSRKRGYIFGKSVRNLPSFYWRPPKKLNWKAFREFNQRENAHALLWIIDKTWQVARKGTVLSAAWDGHCMAFYAHPSIIPWIKVVNKQLRQTLSILNIFFSFAWIWNFWGHLTWAWQWGWNADHSFFDSD